ncbi:MAG: carboxypeptidase regulatory-like domain-containing protein [Candidatus Sericytochromatia bacterium]|nr:carboxypeptidase regulatory-like domain-containing protein [Candidatus Tanganyikabacteria bacterium]
MMKRFLTTLLVAMLAVFVLAGCGRRGVGTDAGGDGDKSTGTISVLVNQDGKAVAGALVQLSDGSGAAIDQGQTDESGQAAFEKVNPGDSYVVKAEKGGATGAAEGIRVAGGSEAVKVKIELKLAGGPTAVVTGKVTDSQTGAPIPGAKVSAGDAAAEAGADGAYKLDKVAAGAVTLKAEAAGYTAAAKDLTLKPGSSQTVDLALDAVSKGPRAGHTVITTTSKVVEVDAWHNAVLSIPTQEAWSATYVPGAGTILIADAARWGGIAVEMSPTGSKVASFDGAKLGIFGHVSGIRGASRTKFGNTMIADTKNNRVLELDTSNNKVWEYKKGLKAPRWAERLENGNTLIVDTGNNRVIELNPSGDIVFGVGDGTAGILNNPTHATFLKKTNTYLVTDAGNNRVMEINRKAQMVWMAGGARKVEDGGAGNLNNPNSATRLPGGNTLIADTGNNRVIEIEPGLGVVWKMPAEAPLYADRI